MERALCPEYQRAVGDMVNMHVHANITLMLSELAKTDDYEVYEEVRDVQGRDPVFTSDEDGSCSVCHEVDVPINTEHSCDVCEECFDTLELEPEAAYENWIVSEWMSEQLTKRKEIVGEVCSVTVWGRQCTGQAIKLDHVMCKIYDETQERG